MGVVDRLFGLVGTVGYLASYFLVGIPEGHALQGEFVDFLDRENMVVFAIVENVGIDLDMFGCIGGNFETRFEVVKHRKEYLLHHLHVTKIAAGQVIGDHRQLVGQCLDFVAMAPDKLEDIGVLFVGHDA